MPVTWNDPASPSILLPRATGVRKMAEYRETVNGDYVVRRRSATPVILGVLLILALIVAVLFATGFWSAKVTREGELPDVSVKATGGELPKVDVDSKKVVVGTKQTTVDVPTVQTKKTAVDVPVVGVKN
jgi:hypothetical protein